MLFNLIDDLLNLLLRNLRSSFAYDALPYLTMVQYNDFAFTYPINPPTRNRDDGLNVNGFSQCLAERF